MNTIARNIYKVILKNNKQRTSLRNLYIIKGDGRSLMIDTSWKEPECLHEMEHALNELGISYDALDIFVTHNHADHSGYVSYFTDRGARAFMNPIEIASSSDRYHRFFLDNEMRKNYIHQTGAAKELVPDAWQEVSDGADRLARENNINFHFPFTPVLSGDKFSCGGYCFEVLPLYGHTSGQCGLVERKEKLLFCADQVIHGIVPIVITSGKDQRLLSEYIASLKELRDSYNGYRFLPGHYEEFYDIHAETDRIFAGYSERCTQLLSALDDSKKPMTLLELDRALYIRRKQTYRYTYLFSYLNTWPKLFSCLEYLADTNQIIRTEKDGVLYWSR